MTNIKLISHILSVALLLGSCSVCKKQNDYSYIIRRTPKKDRVIYYPFVRDDKICQMDTTVRKKKLHIVWQAEKSAQRYYMQLPANAQIVGMDSDWTMLQFPNNRILLVCFGYY